MHTLVGCVQWPGANVSRKLLLYVRMVASGFRWTTVLNLGKAKEEKQAVKVPGFDQQVWWEAERKEPGCPLVPGQGLSEIRSAP